MFKTIKEKIISKLRFELGITKLEEEKESLFYLFNNCLDITKMPPTKDPDLRILQKCDALLLAIFDKLCKKHNLRYWLHWGTLLGAVRHRGFIPWDDDVDIAMPREDINKVLPLMKEEIESFGFSMEYSRMHPLRGLVLSYKEKEVGLWIDIFPLDQCTSNDDISKIHKAIMQYRRFFWTNKYSEEEGVLTEKKKEVLSSLPKGNIDYYLIALEVREGVTECLAIPKSEIYPLARMNFEGYELNVPSMSNIHLKRLFGDNFMDFPHNAINNHGQNNSFAKRAKANGIDMNEVYNYLLEIYNKVSQEI